MKNISLIVITFFVFISCNQKSNSLIVQAEDFLKTNLKDPSSYENISSEIVDSVKFSKALEEDLDRIEDYLLIGMAKKSEKDSIINLISELKNNPPKDKIKYIDIRIKYRAKNSFGALDIGNATIYYLLETPPSGKRFILYSNK